MTVPMNNIGIADIRIHRNTYGAANSMFYLPQDISATLNRAWSTNNSALSELRGGVGIYMFLMKANTTNGTVDLTNTYSVSAFGSMAWATAANSWNGQYIQLTNFDSGYTFTLNGSLPVGVVANGPYTVEFWTYGNSHTAMNNTSTQWPIIGNTSSGFNLRLQKTSATNALTIVPTVYNGPTQVGNFTSGPVALVAGMNSWVIQGDPAHNTTKVYLNGNQISDSYPMVPWNFTQWRYGNVGYGPAIHFVDIRLSNKVRYPGNPFTVSPPTTPWN